MIILHHDEPQNQGAEPEGVQPNRASRSFVRRFRPIE
jgi:hypothetical protein